ATGEPGDRRGAGPGGRLLPARRAAARRALLARRRAPRRPAGRPACRRGAAAPPMTRCGRRGPPCSATPSLPRRVAYSLIGRLEAGAARPGPGGRDQVELDALNNYLRGSSALQPRRLLSYAFGGVGCAMPLEDFYAGDRAFHHFAVACAPAWGSCTCREAL